MGSDTPTIDKAQSLVSKTPFENFKHVSAESIHAVTQWWQRTEAGYSLSSGLKTVWLLVSPFTLYIVLVLNLARVAKSLLNTLWDKDCITLKDHSIHQQTALI